MIRDDFTIRVVDDLPADGMVMESPDGHYNIYISAKLAAEKQKPVCVHELGHIQYGHLHKEGDVHEMEKEADHYIEEFDEEKLGCFEGV